MTTPTFVTLPREVVEQLVGALEPMGFAKLADGTYADKDCKITMAITAGRAALATEQPKGEARACEVFSLGEWCLWPIDRYEEALQRGWPVRLLFVEKATKPAQVPLTDEELDSIVARSCKRDSSHLDAARVARAIEAAHGIGAKPPTEVDWQAVGRIIDAHLSLGRSPLVAGSSNWGAMIYKACHGIGAKP